MNDQTMNPGVYLCSGCGIGDAVSVDALEQVASNEYKMPVCRQHDFLCGDEGRALIEADLADGSVNQPIIAACSPRVMTDRFTFDGVPAIRANLREQVAWTQAAGEEDTQMLADDYLRMAIAQAAGTLPTVAGPEGEYSRTVLVLGGGSTGLNAALEAANTGYEVLLVEREDKLGGWANNWSKTLPHLPPYRDPQPNTIDELIAAVEAESAITVLTGTLVTRTEGGPGKFDVTLSTGDQSRTEYIGAIVVATGWRPYDANKLGHLGYGQNTDVVTAIELEEMLGDEPLQRKSDSSPAKIVLFVQCAGSRDPEHLPYCSSVCCEVSIKQALQVVTADPDASVYILFEELRTPGTAEEFYRQAQEAGVIFIKGKVKSVSADLGVTYDDLLLGEEVNLQGLDMVVLATGMVPNSTNPELEPSEQGAEQLLDDINPKAPLQLAIKVIDSEAKDSPAEATTATPAPTGNGQASSTEATAAEPPALPGGPLLNLQYVQGPHIPMLADGFSDSHYICFPYETRRTGIYTCGPVRRPMDMAESSEDAAGAVLKAIQSIENAARGAAMHPRVGDLSYPKIGLNTCTKCRRCTIECPFGAIEEDENSFPILIESRCRRCGTCMGACPVRTISFDNYSPNMVLAMIDAIEVPDEFDEKPRIMIFACENDAYPALDMAGLNRHQYSAFIRVIPVRCLGSVNLLWVSTALEKGFDGIMLMGCKSGDDYQCHYVKGSALAEERLSKIGETLKSLMLEEERVTMAEVSIADSGNISTVINDFVETIDGIGFNPFKGF
jgi:quinone-modifying oxidoreductase subunit QmoB